MKTDDDQKLSYKFCDRQCGIQKAIKGFFLFTCVFLGMIMITVPIHAEAVEVVFDHGYPDGNEQAVITGYDEGGNAVWTVQTGSYPAAQLSQCCDLGILDGKYYYTEHGSIIALDLADGSRIWENTGFHGSSAHAVMREDGTLFVCGYFGPDLFVVDRNGNTLARVDSFREGYYWPYQLDLDGDILTIHYEQNGESLPVNLSDILTEQAAEEAALKESFGAQIPGNILYFLYDDYDYDGTYEAMAVTEQTENVWINVYFIDHNGVVSDLTAGRSLGGYEFQDSANVRERYLVDTGTQKFYVWENSAGGSGSTSFVFGVKDGKPYEPAVSGNVQGFQKDGDQYVHYINDFSQGFHDYIRTELTFDAASGEFL